MYYIQKSDKPAGSISNYINITCNVVKLEKNKIIIPNIPKATKKKELANEEKNNNQKQKRERNMRKIAKKTIKLLEKTNSKKLILSKNIKEESTYLNYLESFNVEIVDGKWLFSVLSYEVLEYIVNLKKLQKNNVKIAILINDVNSIAIENIKRITKVFKKVNIISNHNEKLKKMQKEIEEEGIILTIINNKRKSLIKTDIILNLDFPEELLNKYSIYEEGIIVNFSNKCKIDKKRFNGNIINNYEINVKKEEIEELVNNDTEKIEKYFTKDIYEAQFYKRQSFIKILNKLKNDEVSIKSLFGNNIVY